jgi:ABC-type sugar transport system permease subunit
MTAGGIKAAPLRRRRPIVEVILGRDRDGFATPWTTAMLFLLPALLVHFALMLYPAALTFWNSVHIIRPNADDVFVGLANYRDLWTDNMFWRSVTNTLLWTGVGPFLDVGLGLLLALALYAGVPFSRFLRVAWFTPVLISYVVVGVLWMWIFNYDWGPLNAGLRAVGLADWQQAWIGDPDIALWSLIVVHAWKWAGFNMVVCLAALHALPREVMEAAELDNCGFARRFWYVMLPMLRPTLVNLLILSIIGKMKVFDLVWIMTQGGPLWSTETVSTYVYKRAFFWSTFDLGYPSAIAVVWFVAAIGLVIVFKTTLTPRYKLEY